MRRLLVVVACIAIIGYTSASSSDTFLAAVVQHEQVASGTSSPAEVMEANMAQYSVSALQAVDEGAQVIVFPEFGLFPSDFNKKCSQPSDMAPWCEQVPSPGDSAGIPCDNVHSFASSPTTVATSCMGKNVSSIVSVNMCEYVPANGSDGAKYFNTQLVVGESGRVLAKYRKSHVFFTKCFDQPATPDLVTFNASFGVEFGLFTCYDILFSSPGPALVKQGVRHFLTSAAIPIVGSVADRVWSWKEGSALVASQLPAGQGGVWLKGSRESKSLPDSGNAVGIGSLPIVIT